MKIRYLNGSIDIHGLETYTSKNKFLTKHPTNRSVYYFLLNKIGVEHFKKYYGFYDKHWEISDEVKKRIFSFVDYTESHEPIHQHNLGGITLLPYQQKAVSYMLSNKKFCIFLGQGTGKTIITLTFLNSILKEEGKKKILIVTPKKVIGQYKKELEKYCIEAKVTNYEQLSKETEEYDIICYDESHRLKNASSGLNKTATNLRAERIYLFTGSPQDKYKHEILAQLRVLQPYLFPAKYKVYERYFYLDDYGNPISDKRPKELNSIIEAMSYGETTENLLNLPDFEDTIIECKFKDKSIYKELESSGVVTLPNNDVVTASIPATLRIKLRQLCNGFLMYTRFDEEKCIEEDKKIVLENPKVEKFKKLVIGLDSAVIYTQFDYDIEIISGVMDELGLSYVCVNGKTKDSDPLIEKFKEGKVNFLIIQAQSGNAGLDLQNTNNIIFYSIPESYVVFEQCRYRIRRIGQKNKCNYYYLITKGSVEKDIYRSLKNKKSYNNYMFSIYRKESHDGVREID